MTAALKASCASSCDACRKYLQFTRDSRKLRRRSGYACGGTRACGDGFRRRRLLFSISFLDCALKMFWISWRTHWVPRWPTSSKRCSKHRYINQNNNNSQNNNSTNRKRNHQTHPPLLCPNMYLQLLAAHLLIKKLVSQGQGQHIIYNNNQINKFRQHQHPANSRSLVNVVRQVVMQQSDVGLQLQNHHCMQSSCKRWWSTARLQQRQLRWLL